MRLIRFQPKRRPFLQLRTILAGMPCTTDLSGQDLGGLTPTPSVYCFCDLGSVDRHPRVRLPGLAGRLRLPDRPHAHHGQPRVRGRGEIAASVVLWHGRWAFPQPWEQRPHFAETIVALTSIALNHDAAILCGRALARNWAVTASAVHGDRQRSNTCARARLPGSRCYRNGKSQLRVDCRSQGGC
jgi:hypothetical protein